MTPARAAGTAGYYLATAVIVLGVVVCLFLGPILEWLER